jgi:hypothetical protein
VIDVDVHDTNFKGETTPPPMAGAWGGVAYGEERAIIDSHTMMWRRASKSRVDGVAGLRDERKTLAVRYTIDAAEAQRREEFTDCAAVQELVDLEESGYVVAKADPTDSSRLGRVSPRRDMISARRDAGAPHYVIELRATGFLWRWAVFDLVLSCNGTAAPLALRSLHAVTSGALPRVSERSARRAAERAAREAYDGTASAGKPLQLQH